MGLRDDAELLLANANEGSAGERVAIAYIEEHPSDEDEPVTEAWWKSLWKESVFCDFDDLFCLWFRSADRTVVLDAESAESGAPVYSLETPAKTRGDVRRLCRALGIQLSEP